MVHWLESTTPDEELLFHYTRESTLHKILVSGSIRMSPYAETNDPRETKEWVVDVIADAAGAIAGSAVNVDFVRLEADRILRGGARVACFTLDRSPNASAARDSLFHRGWARARMWAQYADNHGGACLVFQRDTLMGCVDDARPVADGDLFSFGRVRYIDRPLRISLSSSGLATHGVLDILDDYQTRKGAASELYFNKNMDWATEEEFRVLVVRWNQSKSDLNEPLFAPFGESLRAVVIDDGFLISGVRSLQSALTSYPRIELLRCVWAGGVPSIAGVS